MIKLAIVDDETEFVTMYSKMIKNYFSHNHVLLEVQTFNSGDDFIESLKTDKYDLIFMDIDMPCLSGIDIALELRKNNQSSDLIFVSAHPHFVFETIKFTPYRFIRKINLESETMEAIDSYCSRTQTKFKMISLELQNGNTVCEKVSDIINFFAIRHDVYYITKNETNAKILSRKYSLSQIESFAKEFGFIRVHKSYLVNYRYIENINAKSLVMINRCEIPISHGKKTEIQEQFMELLRNEEAV
jgi:DNA-binding LytR/AlgR family response regulator